jgi:hypothetical protein
LFVCIGLYLIDTTTPIQDSFNLICAYIYIRKFHHQLLNIHYSNNDNDNNIKYNNKHNYNSWIILEEHSIIYLSNNYYSYFSYYLLKFRTTILKVKLIR